MLQLKLLSTIYFLGGTQLSMVKLSVCLFQGIQGIIINTIREQSVKKKNRRVWDRVPKGGGGLTKIPTRGGELKGLGWT